MQILHLILCILRLLDLLFIFLTQIQIGEWALGAKPLLLEVQTLQVQTMCLAMAGFSNLFSSGQSFPIDGISLVMGLDADFSMLNNANTMCFSDFIHGVAFYEVFESPASGSYDVIDWTDPNFDFTTYFTSQNGYAFVFSFDNCNQGNFYFSKEGQITVNGGGYDFFRRILGMGRLDDGYYTRSNN